MTSQKFNKMFELISHLSKILITNWICKEFDKFFLIKRAIKANQSIVEDRKDSESKMPRVPYRADKQLTLDIGDNINLDSQVPCPYNEGFTFVEMRTVYGDPGLHIWGCTTWPFFATNNSVKGSRDR